MATFYLRRGLPDHRKTAEYLGHLNVAWSSVEYRLFSLLSILCDTPLPLARGIFYSQRTTRARLDLLLAVGQIVLRKRRGSGMSSDYRKLSSLIGAIGNLAGERNRFVHDPWAAVISNRSGKAKAYQLRLTGQRPSYESVRATQIVALIRKIENKDNAIRRLYQGLLPKLPALHEKLGKQQLLVLDFATKATRLKKMKAKPSRQHQSHASKP